MQGVASRQAERRTSVLATLDAATARLHTARVVSQLRSAL